MNLLEGGQDVLGAGLPAGSHTAGHRQAHQAKPAEAEYASRDEPADRRHHGTKAHSAAAEVLQEHENGSPPRDSSSSTSSSSEDDERSAGEVRQPARLQGVELRADASAVSSEDDEDSEQVQQADTSSTSADSEQDGSISDDAAADEWERVLALAAGQDDAQNDEVENELVSYDPDAAADTAAEAAQPTPTSAAEAAPHNTSAGGKRKRQPERGHERLASEQQSSDEGQEGDDRTLARSMQELAEAVEAERAAAAKSRKAHKKRRRGNKEQQLPGGNADVANAGLTDGPGQHYTGCAVLIAITIYLMAHMLCAL